MSLLITHALLDAGTAGFVLRLVIGLSAVWLLAGGATLILRRSSAAVRHRIWSLSIVAALVLPAALLMLPEHRVGRIALPPGQELYQASSPTDRSSHPDGNRPNRRADEPDASRAMLVESTRVDESDSGALRASTDPARSDLSNTVAPLPSASRSSRSFGGGWAILAAWLLPALWLVLRQIVANTAARRLVGRAVRISDRTVASCLSRSCSRAEIAAHPRLLESEELKTPVCLGWCNASIVLPQNWRSWSSEQLEAVLTHELAHIARRDVLWQTMARLACGVYWPHPLAWAAARRMRVERELACDDWVLRGGQSSTRYARWLLDVAAMISGRAHAAERMGVAMATRSGLEKRVSAILDPRRRRFAVTRSTAVLLAIITIVLLAAVGTLSPFAPKPVGAQLTAKSGPATKPALTEAKTVQVTGRVEDEQGRPAADVAVDVTSLSDHYSTRTDASGRFTVKVTAERFYAVFQASTADRSRQAFCTIDGATQPKLADVRLILRPARKISVSVNDDKGQPVGRAWVMVDAGYTTVAEATTDDAGTATLQMPADAPPQFVLTAKPGIGLDYAAFWRKDQIKTDPYRLDLDYAGPLKFILNGATDVKVRVIDDQQRPLAGVIVYPWIFEKPKHGGDANISGVTGLQRTTDAAGVADFPMVPADSSRSIVFWPRIDGYFAPKRCIFDPKAGKTTLEVEMVPLVKVTGQIVDAAGGPVADATLKLSGDNYEMDGFRGETHSTADGTFQIAVAPDMYYIFSCAKDHTASTPQRVMVRKGRTVPPLRFTLQPATRVYGRATAGPTQAVTPGAHISLLLMDDSYLKLPKEEQFSGGTAGRKAITLMLAQFADADENGLFEFYAGPGKYYVRWYTPSKPFVIFEQKEVEVNVHSDEAEVAPKLLAGRVVFADKPNVGVADAVMSGRIVSHNAYTTGATDSQGRFTVQRDNSDLYLMAVTSDGGLRGISLVKPADDNITLSVGPTASARGRLLDPEAKPLVDRIIRYGITVRSPGGGFTTSFGGDTRTAPDGRFVLDRLVPGFDYELSVLIESNAEGQFYGYRPVGTAGSAGAGLFDAGDFTLPNTPLRKTAKDYAAEAFVPTQTLEQRLKHARHVAQVSCQNILVLLGPADGPASVQFFEYRQDLDHPEAWNALMEYVLLALNTSSPDARVQAWAQKTGIAPPTSGLTFAVLGPDGGLVCQTSEQALWADGRLDRQKLIDFARQYAPAKPDARKLLDDGLAQAAREGKHVLLEQGGPYCVWCVKLADYVAANRKLIDKDFVYVSIDRRFAHGKEILDPLRRDHSSTPWIAILGTDGRPLINSDDPKSNVNLPISQEGRTQWENMLRSGEVGQVRGTPDGVVYEPAGAQTPTRPLPRNSA